MKLKHSCVGEVDIKSRSGNASQEEKGTSRAATACKGEALGRSCRETRREKKERSLQSDLYHNNQPVPQDGLVKMNIRGVDLAERPRGRAGHRQPPIDKMLA